jgi:hypothetical protein
MYNSEDRAVRNQHNLTVDSVISLLKARIEVVDIEESVDYFAVNTEKS